MLGLATTFKDRIEAGHRLAALLQHLRNRPVVVLGLPRGGVLVAAEVATALGAPLDVVVVRKLGVPFQPELAMGAIGECGAQILDAEVVRMTGVSQREIANVEARERAELDRRVHRYRNGRPPVPLHGQVAVVVDDGIATGSTARAACRAARARGADHVVLAVPVAPVGWEERIGRDADECVSVECPESFFAIGQFYSDFSQTSDEEVIACLERAGPRAAVPDTRPPEMSAHPATDPVPVLSERDVRVPVGTLRLEGRLSVPDSAREIVVFAHGSGSSRHSPRNRYVASILHERAMGTLLFDLLTAEEERSRASVFDVDLLARRLSAVTNWLRAEPVASGFPIAYFGASTGSAAALWAAAEPGADIAAVVSRGGRPDLAGSRLPRVTAPTLLIVGGRDTVVLDLNRTAKTQLRCESQLEVVPGATHLFEEPGTLRMAAELAREWFVRHLPPSSAPGGMNGT